MKMKSNTQPSEYQQLKAGLKAFFRISGEWNLSDEDRRILLGLPDKALYSEWEAGKVNSRAASPDLLDRLSYVLGIYQSLKIMHSPENQVNFLKNPTEVTPFLSKSPLDYMLSGHLDALSEVRQYLALQH